MTAPMAPGQSTRLMIPDQMTAPMAPGQSTRLMIPDQMIAPMAPEHLPEVMAIDAQCYPIPWSQEAYELELSRPDDRLYLVSRPHGVVGHAGVAFEKDEAHVTTMTVAPAYRGRGIGTHLFLALAVAARRRNSSLALEVAADNPAAQALYRRFGLAPVGIHRGYYADMGLSPDAVVMRADNINQPDYASRLAKIAVELDSA